MRTESISPCITTDKVQESRDFYVKYLDAKVNFDCGWYVDLHFGGSASSLQFMSPQQPGQPLCDCAGLTYNFAVCDVDQEHDQLALAGLKPVLPLEDHPWGDRGFAIMDPNGIMLYFYTEIEPSEEFKQYYK
jgi:uncharacterized glyoxalase superfamily protein PhnB